MNVQHVAELSKQHSVRMCCEALGVPRSTFYDLPRRSKEREQREAPVVAKMRQVHAQRFKRSYGSPRMAAELRAQGMAISRHRTARLMRKHGISAKKPKHFVRTTDSGHGKPVAESLIHRDFAVGEANKTWSGDITYVTALTCGCVCV